LALTDKVLFLSEFQRRLHPAVPDGKVYLTRNGVDLTRHLYTGEAKEKKLIFCSSPDRGWLSTIDLFRASELEHEGWQLHMFYGFGRTWREMTTRYAFSHIPDLGIETNRYVYEADCLDACDGQSVINRGRIGWEQIAQEFKTAAGWVYPTKFDEISCVAAMEAMAAGCVIFATDHAALAETLRDYPAWINLGKESPATWHSLLGAIECPTPAQATQWAKHARKFSMDNLVEQWIKDLI
jgi:glycosyltransferase involved in cell wall biosynthesis